VYAKPSASPGCTDDEVITAAIAIQLHLHGGIIRGEKAAPKIEGTDFAKPKPKEPKIERKPSLYDWSTINYLESDDYFYRW